MEVGFGKGLFLLSRPPTAIPDVNFVGVEIVRKYQLYTATRLAKRRPDATCASACADARLFLRDCVGAASLQAVHVYFPDPWWKKRHHKRRVFTAEFAAQCVRVLRPGGRLAWRRTWRIIAAGDAGLLAALPELRAAAAAGAGDAGARPGLSHQLRAQVPQAGAADLSAAVFVGERDKWARAIALVVCTL